MCDISQMNSEIAGYIQTMQDELSTLFLRGEIADAPEKCMRKSTNEASNFSRTCKGELRGKDNVKRQRPSARKEALRIENMKLRNALRSSVLCQSGELGGRIDVPPRRNIMKKRTEVASDNLNSRNEELRRKKKITRYYTINNILLLIKITLYNMVHLLFTATLVSQILNPLVFGLECNSQEPPPWISLTHTNTHPPPWI
eukprot:GHVR01012244.1.p1 GENE.GHVR01012244.1~~GHVR01012244.1.p1  ORF type:complete len:200 (-),score=13.20 GHVR01012244.1:133-732(-)